MYLSSPARTRLALGPGRAVLILGPAIRVLVGIGILLHLWSFVVGSWRLGFDSPLTFLRASQLSGLRPEENLHRRGFELIACEKTGTEVGRKPCQMAPRAA